MKSWREYDNEDSQAIQSKCNRLEDELSTARLEIGNVSRRLKRVLRSKDQEIKDLRLELMREKATKRTLIDDLEQEHDNQRQSWMDEKERLQQRLGELEDTGRDQPRTHPIVVVGTLNNIKSLPFVNMNFYDMCSCLLLY